MGEARRIAANIAKLPEAIEPPSDVGSAMRRGSLLVCPQHIPEHEVGLEGGLIHLPGP